MFFIDPQLCKNNAQSERFEDVHLPSTVGVRRRHADGRSRRRSECVQEKGMLSEGDLIGGFGALESDPISSENRNPNQPPQGAEPDFADHIDTKGFQHSTPEPVPAKKNNQQRPSRKQTQQQPCNKSEPAGQKPERDRKPERAPLKKPWENPKPRARSKSRDRSAMRSKAAPPSQGNKLNTSLGCNDTFDFECEGTVHVTPFRTKTEDSQPATPISGETPQKGGGQTKVSPVVSNKSISSSSSPPSSESEDSLYVPQKARRRRTSPVETNMITTRRGRPSKVTRQKENIPLKQEITGEVLGS